jgi:membrane dipeptidase
VASTTLADFIGEIARLVDVVGIAHVALGTDLDANVRPVLTHHEEFRDRRRRACHPRDDRG